MSNVTSKSERANSAQDRPRSSGELRRDDREDFQVMMDEVGVAVAQYCKKRPGVAGGLLFAVGFFVGWRLKPW